MPLKESQIRAKSNYKKKTRMISVEFNMETEGDIYDFLTEQGNKSKYIKELIRTQMKG